MNVEIKFPIIADTGKVAEALGIIHPGKGSKGRRSLIMRYESAYFIISNAIDCIICRTFEIDGEQEDDHT